MNLNHLNQEQRQAVLHTEGPLLILAGAGSGKTRVLIHRIAYLINKEGVSPENILAITFTNKAAKEMKERLNAILGNHYRGSWVSTFHSACVRILRMEIEKLGYGKNFIIYDTMDQLVVIKDCFKKLNLDDKIFDPKSILNSISKAKDKLITPTEYEKAYIEDFRSQKIAKVYEMYQKKLKSNNALDFDDLIMKTVLLFEQFPLVLDYYQSHFKYILIDEFQDTNMGQYRLISLLSKKHQNLCVVGDDDQSIYGWRGADIKNILGFEKDFPNAEVIKLEENYRSTKNILEAANSVVSKNYERKNKKLWTSKEEGKTIGYYCADNEHDEGRYIADSIDRIVRNENKKYSDFAILYRTNAQSRVLEDRLMREAIPYKIYGGTPFYSRKEIKDIVAYLNIIENAIDDVSIKRVINVPKRGVGAKAVEKLDQFAESTEKSFFDALVEVDKVAGLSSSQKAKVKQFATIMIELQKKKDMLSLTELTEEIYEKTGYMQSLFLENTVESLGRIENLEEFKSLTLDYDKNSETKTLEDFLAKTSLESATDNLGDEENVVVLTTLHSAKGLEFPIVFMPGMEEGIFPSPMAIKEKNEEEERRLCYVGITRAMERLYMTHTRMRTLYGRTSYHDISRFIDEIPKELIERKISYNRKKQVHEMQTSSIFKGKLVHEESVSLKTDSLIKSGSKIKHPKFGSGTVITLDGSIVSIAFDGMGIKKIDMAFINLNIVE